jgi:hypothetical protein
VRAPVQKQMRAWRTSGDGIDGLRSVSVPVPTPGPIAKTFRGFARRRHVAAVTADARPRCHPARLARAGHWKLIAVLGGKLIAG